MRRILTRFSLTTSSIVILCRISQHLLIQLLRELIELTLKNNLHQLSQICVFAPKAALKIYNRTKSELGGT